MYFKYQTANLAKKNGSQKFDRSSHFKKITKCKHHLLHVSLFLIWTRALEHVVCLGESRLSQVNNSPRPNVFPAGVANFSKAMYRSLERSTQDTRDGFFFVQCPGLIFLAARWSGPAASASIFSVCLDYILRVCQSLWDSFLYLGKLHWFLYLLLSYFYDPGMFIFCWSSNFVEKVVLNESMAAKMASRVSYLVYYNCI